MPNLVSSVVLIQGRSVLVYEPLISTHHHFHLIGVPNRLVMYHSLCGRFCDARVVVEFPIVYPCSERPLSYTTTFVGHRHESKMP